MMGTQTEKKEKQKKSGGRIWFILVALAAGASLLAFLVRINEYPPKVEGFGSKKLDHQ